MEGNSHDAAWIPPTPALLDWLGLHQPLPDSIAAQAPPARLLRQSRMLQQTFASDAEPSTSLCSEGFLVQWCASPIVCSAFDIVTPLASFQWTIWLFEVLHRFAANIQSTITFVVEASTAMIASMAFWRSLRSLLGVH